MKLIPLLFAMLLLLEGYTAYNAYSALTPPTLKTPLVLSLTPSVGMAPLTLTVKVRAQAEGREVCVVVDGPESSSSCRALWGITWVQDYTLRSGGAYEVYAASGKYQTARLQVRVVGLEGQ